jgi:hypothetical protein
MRLGRVFARQRQTIRLSRNWQFWRAVFRLIWQYRGYGLAILGVTVFQELAALWPVNLLGQFVDRLQTGELGHTVWLFLGATLLNHIIVRTNVVLRHRMFYQTEFDQRVELILGEAERCEGIDAEEASAAHTRIINAVSGITNAAYHVLGSFTPVIIKIVVVSSSLLAYNRLIGVAYLASLIVPGLLTIVFNKTLRVLRDAQYSVISESSGVGVRVIVDGSNEQVRDRFVRVIRERSSILVSLVSKHQVSLLVREGALVGCQFTVIFLALALRERIGLTPGDFTRIVGYTTQVGVAFINTASFLDAIMSHSRAYHVFDQARRPLNR